MGESEIKDALALVDEGRIVELAKGLIRIPSVTGEEREVVLHARDVLEESGIGVDLHGPGERPVKEYRPAASLVASGSPGWNRLSMFSSMKTVMPSTPNSPGPWNPSRFRSWKTVP